MTSEQLQQTRAERWRQNSNPILTSDDASAWIDAVGFCLYLPRHAHFQAPAASFVEAVAGARSDTPARDTAESAAALLHQLIAESRVVPLNLFGEAGGGASDQPDFIVTRANLPYVFSMIGGRNWKSGPGTKASPLMNEIWTLLEKQGALTAQEIQSTLGRELTEAAVLRALVELWRGLRVIPVRDGDTTQWELTQARFEAEMTASQKVAQTTALSVLVSLYLEAVVAASTEEIETFLSPLTARSRIREVVNGLMATRQLAIVSVAAQPLVHIAGSLPEFAPEEQAAAQEPQAWAPRIQEPRTREPRFQQPHAAEERRERRQEPRTDRRPERKPFDRGRKPFDRERKPFQREERFPRQASKKEGNFEQRPYDQKRSERVRPPFRREKNERSERRQGPEKKFRPEKPFRKAKPFGDREPGKPRFERERGERDRPSFKDRGEKPREWKQRKFGASQGEKPRFADRKGPWKPKGERSKPGERRFEGDRERNFPRQGKPEFRRGGKAPFKNQGPSKFEGGERKSFPKSDRPFGKFDKPFAKPGKPFGKSTKPFGKREKSFGKSGKPAFGARKPGGYKPPFRKRKREGSENAE